MLLFRLCDVVMQIVTEKKNKTTIMIAINFTFVLKKNCLLVILNQIHSFREHKLRKISDLSWYFDFENVSESRARAKHRNTINNCLFLWFLIWHFMRFIGLVAQIYSASPFLRFNVMIIEIIYIDFSHETNNCMTNFICAA
jgi:hypothetical protein